MADAEPVGALSFEVDGLEATWKKRTKEFQSPKFNYKTWPVDQQQDLQAEREELEDDLRQLRKRFADMELADVRAATELKQLLSRPLGSRDGSPDIEELFAEANRRDMELRRIKAERDRPGQDKMTILHEIEKIQIKLEELGGSYALVRKETQRQGHKLKQSYERQSQPDYSSRKHRDDAAQGRYEPLVKRPDLSAKELSGFLFASTHEDSHKRSREVSIKTIRSTESMHSESITPRRPITNRTSAVPVTKPQRKLSKLSPVIFRSQQGRYKTERARPGRNWLAPTGHQNRRLALSPTLTKLEHVNTSLLPDIRINAKNENFGGEYPNSSRGWLSSAGPTREDTETLLNGSVRCAFRGVPNQQGRRKYQNTEHRDVGVRCQFRTWTLVCQL